MTTHDTAGLCERLRRTYALFPHDNHGGYGECGGSGQVWVDDGQSSNYYRGGTCKRCADNTPGPVNPDGPQAADTLERQAAEIERLRALLMLARPFVADDTEATCDLADRIDAALGL